VEEYDMDVSQPKANLDADSELDALIAGPETPESRARLIEKIQMLEMKGQQLKMERDDLLRMKRSSL
jgi:hypothetical protein